MKTLHRQAGKLLPESEAEFNELRPHLGPDDLYCVNCRALFSSANTHTPAGWRETQISGGCEDCFDALFGDPS